MSVMRRRSLDRRRNTRRFPGGTPGDPDRNYRVPIGWVNTRWRRATFGMPASAVMARAG